MYWPDKHVFTIDIPKTACVTRWRIGKAMHGRRILPGHRKMSEAIVELEELGIDVENIEFWTVIRNPAKRLVSACNYHYAQLYKATTPGPDLYSYLKQIQESKYADSAVFRSQSSWLDSNYDVKLWPMEHYDEMIRALGWEGPIKRENESHKTWATEELVESPYYNNFMDKYASDWDLYHKALNK